MSFLKNILKGKGDPIRDYNDFWLWFKKNEQTFFNAVKKGNNIERDFFNKLSPKLAELKDGYFYVTGMLNESTVELIMTADGTIKDLVFVEELVSAAPAIPGWKITALKPALDIKDVRIKMQNYVFDSDSLFFYSNDHKDYPDLIDISIVHKDYKEGDNSLITNGVFIFLDNYLGELNFATTVDNVVVTGSMDAKKELIPITKLRDFLIWREKEFMEKYDGVLRNTDDAEFSMLEATRESGNKFVAIVNVDILNWENKASHPWILNIEIKFDEKENGGMPDEKTYHLLNAFEDKVLEQLKDFEGYLNIGRQTSKGLREIYFACKDFRKPSKILHTLIGENPNLNIAYDIFKDKYWQTFNRFRSN